MLQINAQSCQTEFQLRAHNLKLFIGNTSVSPLILLEKQQNFSNLLPLVSLGVCCNALWAIHIFMF